MAREDDPDREAILARRGRLVAVALSGLTTLAACGADPAPTVCLSVVDPGGEQVREDDVREDDVREDDVREDDVREDDVREDDGPAVPEVRPMPCLSPIPHRPDEADEAQPVPCLSPPR